MAVDLEMRNRGDCVVTDPACVESLNLKGYLFNKHTGRTCKHKYTARGASNVDIIIKAYNWCKFWRAAILYCSAVESFALGDVCCDHFTSGDAAGKELVVFLVVVQAHSGWFINGVRLLEFDAVAL
jgi:hypothetical protein